MAQADITQLKDLKTGKKLYPITSSACVGMSDGSGNLDAMISKLGGKPGKVDANSSGSGEVFNDYINNHATGHYAHSEGYRTTASGNYAHTEGMGSSASGVSSHAQGTNCSAENAQAHAEGYTTKAQGISSHAEGTEVIASGNSSHAEGKKTLSEGEASHAEGNETTASGNYAHAEGNGAKAIGLSAHAEGTASVANGNHSHVEGYQTSANGDTSHAEGNGAVASGQSSHSANRGTVADNYAQTSIGMFNEEDNDSSPNSYNATKPAFLIGNGGGPTTRGNAFKVLFNGQTFSDGQYSSAGADYAECFEWEDANTNKEDRIGRFVTLDGDKIRLATATDTYILGIISATPTVIGDNPMRWQGKYLNDEWGRPIYEDIEITYKELEKQEDGTEIEVEKTRIDHVRKLNPAYNSEKKYIPRTERPEWDYVGLMGKLLVKQDGTLVAGSFCKSGVDGVATKAESGYYVMKVINENQVLVLFR